MQPQNPNPDSPMTQTEWVKPEKLKDFLKFLVVKQLYATLEANFNEEYDRFCAGVDNISRLLKHYLNNSQKKQIEKIHKAYLRDIKTIKHRSSLNISEQTSLLGDLNYHYHSVLLEILLDALYSPEFLPERLQDELRFYNAPQVAQFSKLISRRNLKQKKIDDNLEELRGDDTSDDNERNKSDKQV